MELSTVSPQPIGQFKCFRSCQTNSPPWQMPVLIAQRGKRTRSCDAQPIRPIKPGLLRIHGRLRRRWRRRALAAAGRRRRRLKPP